MSTPLTNPTITLLYEAPADSHKINTRFHGIRQTGIYDGLYLEYVSGTSFTLSAGTFEIADKGGEDYQVKIVSEQTTVTGTVGQYIVLRWEYTGSETADIPYAYDVATPESTDLIVAKITAGYGIDYGDTDYPRTEPNTLDSFLKVVPDPFTYNAVRVRAGRLQTPVQSVDVSDQKASVLIANPLSGTSRIDLIHINSSGVAQVKQGTDAASPSVPDYAGCTVLAEVTVAHGFTSIEQSDIKDVRNFVSFSLLDEDDFASDSNKQAASQQSIKKYVDDKTWWTSVNSEIWSNASTGVAANTFYEMDTTIGAAALCYFKVVGNTIGGLGYFRMRTKGDTTAWTKFSPGGVYSLGSIQSVYFTSSIVDATTFLICPCDSNGKVEIGSDSTSSKFTITLLGYIK